MFNQISEKLKLMAKILFWISIGLGVVFVFIGLRIGSEDGIFLVMFISAAIAIVSGYMSCVQLYGFAEIIENTDNVVEKLSETNKRLANVAETNSRIVNVVAKSLPEILITLEEQAKKQENE